METSEAFNSELKHVIKWNSEELEVEEEEDQKFIPKYEPTEDDEEIEFQFCLDEGEYIEVLRELKSYGSDLEDDSELKITCPHEGCKRAFSRKHNLLKHLKSHELGVDKPGSICHICGKYVKGVYSLHLKIHDSQKQFRCDDCGKEFRQKVALNNHLLIHRDEKPYQCPYCSKCFRQKYTMESHTRNRHIGIKDYICELCGKEFSDRATLQKHTLVHSTSKPYQCSTCFMSFRHKSSLSRHNKIHLKVTECVHCKKSFRYESFLKKHLLTAHIGQDVTIDYIIPKTERKEECISVIEYENEHQPQVIHQVIDDSSSHYYSQQPVSITISNVHASFAS